MGAIEPPPPPDPAAPPHLPVLTCVIPIPLGLARLRLLIRGARAQHIPLTNSNTDLPDDANEYLRQDWEEIVYEVVEVLYLRLSCVLFWQVHFAPDAEVDQFNDCSRLRNKDCCR